MFVSSATRVAGHRRGGPAIAIVLAACLLVGTTVLAQTKAAKEADRLSRTGDTAQESIEDVLAQIEGMLVGYNSIIDGGAKNTQSAYKKLSGDVKSAEKKIHSARKDLDSLNEQAARFFEAWEAELQGYTNESLKEMSLARLSASKARYDAMGQALAEAGEAFDPLVQELKEQIMFMGRDLSPEAIADLEQEAAALNERADEMAEKVRSLLESVEQAEKEVDEKATSS